MDTFPKWSILSAYGGAKIRTPPYGRQVAEENFKKS